MRLRQQAKRCDTLLGSFLQSQHGESSRRAVPVQIQCSQHAVCPQQLTGQRLSLYPQGITEHVLGGSAAELLGAKVPSLSVRLCSSAGGVLNTHGVGVKQQTQPQGEEFPKSQLCLVLVQLCVHVSSWGPKSRAPAAGPGAPHLCPSCFGHWETSPGMCVGSERSPMPLDMA